VRGIYGGNTYSKFPFDALNDLFMCEVRLLSSRLYLLWQLLLIPATRTKKDQITATAPDPDSIGSWIRIKSAPESGRAITVGI
jgi:hypothetical protein